MRYGAVREET
jgi:hypothetical protein